MDSFFFFQARIKSLPGKRHNNLWIKYQAIVKKWARLSAYMRLCPYRTNRPDYYVYNFSKDKSHSTMPADETDSEFFKLAVKRLCQVNNISTRKLRFQTIENLVVISVKNQFKDSVDLDCFHILNLIYQVIAPLGVKFNQQLYTYRNSKRVARVTVTFKKEDYDTLNMRTRDGILDD